MSGPRYYMSKESAERALMWSWFFPKEDRRPYDLDLIQQLDDGATVLTIQEAGAARIWYDYVPDHVLDNADEDLAERLDHFLCQNADDV